jgi:hypothetical protein
MESLLAGAFSRSTRLLPVAIGWARFGSTGFSMLRRALVRDLVSEQVGRLPEVVLHAAQSQRAGSVVAPGRIVGAGRPVTTRFRRPEPSDTREPRGQANQSRNRAEE